MSDCNDVQALEKISTEVGESQIRITLSSQCIKAQAFLVEKLRKQSERQKEICSFMNSSNLKLQTEISQAELEIKSLLIAQATIKSANVELKKECLILKERRLEIKERISHGEQKYEQLWLQAKSRYESLPFVQNLLQAQNKAKSLRENIIELENNYDNLRREINAKNQYFIDLDKKRIIDLAEYLVRIVPKGFKTVFEKTKLTNEISREIDTILKDSNRSPENHIPMNTSVKSLTLKNIPEKTTLETDVDDGWFNIYQNIDSDTVKMPKIQFIDLDFDVLNDKWDKIKIKKDEIEKDNLTPSKRSHCVEEDLQKYSKKLKCNNDFSVYYNNANDYTVGNMYQKNDNYSKRKLINILDNVKLDENQTYDIITKIDPNKLKGIDKIGEDSLKDSKTNQDEQETEEIEEIDLTKSYNKTPNMIVPPTQFLDYTEDLISYGTQQEIEVTVHMASTSGNTYKLFKNSQENINKKKVSFDIPISTQDITSEISENKSQEITVADASIDSQIDASLVSDESYTKMKDIMLKKHNLDLSPQFVYAKATNNCLSNNNEKNITSKFFQPDKDFSKNNDQHEKKDIETTQKEIKEVENSETDQNGKYDNPSAIETDIVIVSSPKANPTQTSERQVTGFLFNHNTQGIPESLNVSLSTTGFEDGDADFPHCIDSSLLLSPKADMPLSVGRNNAEILSQEVPNFLSGIRKTGLLLFGQPNTETISDTERQTSNNFNFNFGGDEKKARGGLFSMFR